MVGSTDVHCVGGMKVLVDHCIQLACFSLLLFFFYQSEVSNDSVILRDSSILYRHDVK